MQPILLALSTFRQSDTLVRNTIELARDEGADLFVAFVVDINLARYFIGSGVLVGSELRQTTESEILDRYEKEATAKAENIARMAAQVGVPCETRVVRGRFGVETMKIVDEIGPSKITLTRTQRPRWVIRFFGSPAKHIIDNAPCPVIEDLDMPSEKTHTPRKASGAGGDS